MIFDVVLIGPDDYEELVAGFVWRTEEGPDNFAEMYREDGRTMLAIYPESGEAPRRVPVADLLAAIGLGMDRLGW